MSKYSSVTPEEPAFIGGVVVSGIVIDQTEIPIHFNNKNRRRLFYIILAVGAIVAILTIAVLIYVLVH
jgi:hypothetical protein